MVKTTSNRPPPPPPSPGLHGAAITLASAAKQVLSLSAWQIPSSEATRQLFIATEKKRRQEDRKASKRQLEADATRGRSSASSASSSKRPRAGAHNEETTSDHGSEDEEEFIPNADDLRKFKESIMFEIQSELIEGLGVQKLSRQRHQLAGCDEYRKTKMLPSVMDAITVLAEDHRRSHQHTSMILVSSLTNIK